eukprot:scaffold1189_cov194-Amphora_coffeaeformis.AAC.3
MGSQPASSFHRRLFLSSSRSLRPPTGNFEESKSVHPMHKKLTMATTNMETRNGGVPEIQTQEGNSEAPSGFILKLFQMVNGAPDEVITVSCKQPPFGVL